MRGRLLMLVLAALLSTNSEELLDQILDHSKKVVHVAAHNWRRS